MVSWFYKAGSVGKIGGGGDGQDFGLRHQGNVICLPYLTSGSTQIWELKRFFFSYIGN